VFKKAENSLGGDDKAIEKAALDWMNEQLKNDNITLESIYEIDDGLNLIYAVEVRLHSAL
jgi:hypothetical protein